MARKYELKRRAEWQEKTQRRILGTTVGLHGSVGHALDFVAWRSCGGWRRWR